MIPPFVVAALSSVSCHYFKGCRDLLSGTRVKVRIREGPCGDGGPDYVVTSLSFGATESPLLAFLMNPQCLVNAYTHLKAESSKSPDYERI